MAASLPCLQPLFKSLLETTRGFSSNNSARNRYYGNAYGAGSGYAAGSARTSTQGLNGSRYKFHGQGSTDVSLERIQIRHPEPVRISILPHIKEVGGRTRADSQESMLTTHDGRRTPGNKGIVKRTDISII